MNYSQALAWLYATQQHGIKLGLENMHRLCDAMEIDKEPPRCIHVAGTNGKGSVCAMLDSISRCAGYRTGLFTSPHLVIFRERIRVNGEMISEDAVAEGLTRIKNIVLKWENSPTFFEIATALALAYFQAQKAEMIILETGMGGRLDSTNIITPQASVITPIALDHQAWLGSTLELIAREKAGIIKQGVPVVSSPQEPAALSILMQTAREKKSTMRVIEESFARYPVALPGSHQRLNAALALAALEAAKISVDEPAICHGLANVSWPGRFQKISERIILDGAHNQAAAKRLVQTWRENFGDQKATVILGVLQDKDIPAICAALAPLATRFIVTPVQSVRSSTTDEVLLHLKNIVPAGMCKEARNFSSALQSAEEFPERILVTGSLFLVGEALAFFEGLEGNEPSAQ